MKTILRFLAVAALAWLGAAQAQTSVPAIPLVEGPITGPGEMHPGMRDGPEGTNLADFDYIAEEYFVSGTAAGAPYKTRILIRKPRKSKDFSGFVVGEPTHRGGNALICQFARYGIGKRGHGCMTVAARPINLNNPATAGAGLKEFNPERYASLAVTNAQANEVIAQVGRLMQSNLRGGPMGDRYKVKHMILSGTSDSSGATRAYMAPAHATFRMPDGGPIYDGFFVTSTLGNDIVAITDVPTIQMPSQSEVHGSSTWGWRRPDGDVPGNQFRLYEVAGMSHNDARENPAFTGCANPLSHFPHGALTFMGLQHTLNWVAYGRLPPKAARMETDDGTTDGTRVALDEFGNAKGGVRSTYLDVPVGSYTIPNSGPGLCSQTGYFTPFTDERLQSLYRGRLDYLAKILVRTAHLVAEGWFPLEYVGDYILSDALATDIPNRPRSHGSRDDD